MARTTGGVKFVSKYSIMTIAVGFTALFVGTTYMALSATPVKIQACPIAANRFIAPLPTDLVRAIVQGGAQTCVAFSTLKATDQVVTETDARFHVLATVAVQAPTPVPIPTPTPVPVPAASDYTVTVISTDSTVLGATFKQLPTNVSQCFLISNGTQTRTACLPATP